MRIAVWTAVRRVSGAAVAVGVIAAAAPRAQAEEGALYRWETADGTIAFTDDPKRVPERYRDDATAIERSVLTEYGRYTATDAQANQSQAERLAERLAALRAANEADEVAEAELPAVSAAPSHAPAPVTRDIDRRRRFVRPDGSSYYRYYSNRTTVDAPGAMLPVDPNDPNPVVTEKRRVRVPGQPFTQTVTVTRQGDRVLSVVKPRSHHHDIYFEELSDLE